PCDLDALAPSLNGRARLCRCFWPADLRRNQFHAEVQSERDYRRYQLQILFPLNNAGSRFMECRSTEQIKDQLVEI
uniref:Uncharacterized protein n=1 Tax=Oryza brachyantha TaxID=4533 RepID=J3MB52_ORYBR